MTAAGPLAFPGNRQLGDYWRQLAPYRPRAMWIGHFRLFRAEALVHCRRARVTDRFTAILLNALALKVPQNRDQIAERLHMAGPLLGPTLHHLRGQGLVEVRPEGGWTITPIGETARRRHEYPWSQDERLSFYFLDNGPDHPPHFLNLMAPAKPYLTGKDLSFDLSHLKNCLCQPIDWKRRHGFPEDVESLVELAAPSFASVPMNSVSGGSTALATDTPAPGESEEWRRIALVSPERLSAVVIRMRKATGPERLVGFSIQPKNEALDLSRPAFDVEEDGSALTPLLASEPTPEQWRQALKGWLEAINLPAPQFSEWRLDRLAQRLRVTLPRPVWDNFRQARRDIFRSETWLLAGSEQIRAAALLEMIFGN